MLKEALSESFDGCGAQTSAFRKPDVLLVVDGNDLFWKKQSHRLSKSGMFNLTAQKGTHKASEHLKGSRCDLLFMDLSCDTVKDDTYSFIERVRTVNGRSAVALLSANPQPSDVYRAAKLGISDFLVIGPALDIGAEALRILDRCDLHATSCWPPDAVKRTGLFRSAGLSKQEIDIIAEFAKGFPRHRELAERLGKTQSHINKTFSRIYEKLSAAISIDNPSQLTHLITVCSLFR